MATPAKPAVPLAGRPSAQFHERRSPIAAFQIADAARAEQRRIDYETIDSYAGKWRYESRSLKN